MAVTGGHEKDVTFAFSRIINADIFMICIIIKMLYIYTLFKRILVVQLTRGGRTIKTDIYIHKA
jgi:hypothetical protein